MAAEASRGDAKDVDGEMERLLRMLKLSEAEKEGVVLAKEDRSKLPEVKWLAAARLLTSKQFNE